MDILQVVNTNAWVAMSAAALAVIMGVNIRELGFRVYSLIFITAIITAATVIDTWFANTTISKSAAIGWGIGYITDDILLTINAVLPNFVKDMVDRGVNAIKNKFDKWIN